MAVNVRRTIARNQSMSGRNTQILANGLRIQQAADDAAGLSVAEGFRSQVTRLGQNINNAEQASDLLRVAGGSLEKVGDALQRMWVLASQSANGDLSDSQRELLQAEVYQVQSSLDAISQATVYNGRNLLVGSAEIEAENSTAITDSADTGVAAVNLSGAEVGTYTFVDAADGSDIALGNGTITQTLDMGTILDSNKVADGTNIVANFDRLGVQVTLSGAGALRPSGVGDYQSGDLDGKGLIIAESGPVTFLVGPSSEEQDLFAFSLPDMRAASDTLQVDKVVLSTQASARRALSQLEVALNRVALERGRIGGLSNRLGHSISFSENEILNMAESESTIRDADVAKVASDFSRADILRQTSSAMLTQSFTSAEYALQLL